MLRKLQKRTTKFVILSMPRSGSGFLYTLLDSHPDIVTHGELFKPRGIGALSGELRKKRKQNDEWLNETFRDQSPEEFVEQVLGFDAKPKAAGFKLFFPQNERALRYTITSGEFRKIVLRRDNILAMYSSARTAQATKQGKVRQGEAVQSTQIKFDPDDFEYFRNRCDRNTSYGRTLLADSGTEWFDIEYTELKEREAVNRLLAFISVREDVDLLPSVQKRNPGRIEDRFTNPEAVRDYMNICGTEHWLGMEY